MLHEQYLGLVEIVKIVGCLIELTIGMYYMPVELTDIELLSIVEVVTKPGIGLPTAYLTLFSVSRYLLYVMS